MSFGNLDNLNLGMGLKMEPEQNLSAKYATLGDYGTTSKVSPKSLILMLILGLAIFKWYRG